MAIRQDASNEYRAITTTGPNENYTSLCAWVKISVDKNAATSLYSSVDGLGSSQYVVQTAADGVTMAAGGVDALGGSAIVSSPTACTVGQWHFIGVTFLGDGLGGVTAKIYFGSEGDTTLATATASGSVSMSTPALMSMGEIWSTGQWLNGELSNMKIWSGSVLTASELLNEMNQFVPHKTTNLWAWYPLLDSGTQLTDFSGNGRNTSSGGGTPTTVAHPNISWSRPRIRMPISTAVEDPEVGLSEDLGTPPTGFATIGNFGRVVSAPLMLKKKRMINRNLSTLVDDDPNVSIRKLTLALTELQRVSDDLYDKGMFLDNQRDQDNRLPKHGSRCEALDGQYIKVYSNEKSGWTIIKHGLGRIPAGVVWTHNGEDTARADAYIQGYENKAQPADEHTVYIKTFGDRGTYSLGVLF